MGSGSGTNASFAGQGTDRFEQGDQVEIFWPTMKKWYRGSVTEFEPEVLSHGRFTVTYDDGTLNHYACSRMPMIKAA